MTVIPGRHAAHIDGEFVVFLIGMRVNRPLKLHKWLPVAAAMRPMVKELEADPSAGFLGATQGFLAGGPALVQYWRSFEHLERYARKADARHLPAWRKFNQRVRASGDVGIWHETYRVRGRRVRGDLRQHARRRPCRRRRAPPPRQHHRHRGAADRRPPDDTPPVEGY